MFTHLYKYCGMGKPVVNTSWGGSYLVSWLSFLIHFNRDERGGGGVSIV